MSPQYSNAHAGLPFPRPSEPEGRGGVHLWSLRPDVLVEEETDPARLLLRTRWGTLRVPDPTPLVSQALRRMAWGPIRLENLTATGPETRPGEAAGLLALLRRLQHLTVRSLGSDCGALLLSVTPMSHLATFDPPPLDSGTPLRLSRFAVLRQDGAGLLLESPLSLHRVALDTPEAVTTAAALARGDSCAAVAAREPGLSLPLVTSVARYLLATGMLLSADDTRESTRPAFAEDRDPALRAWEFHDLLFHARSRIGRHDAPFGATFPHAGSIPPEPALKEPPTGPEVALEPAPDDPADGGPPLWRMLEDRRSTRAYGSGELSLKDLGHFLHRTARVHELRTTGRGTADPRHYPTTRRPYPSGGGAYELEVYVTSGRCAGLPRAVHYYDPSGHRLIRINTHEPTVAALLGDARTSGGLRTEPPVLLTFTARFLRLSWKYSGMAYSTILKDVGVLYQSMYLAATAMRLAPCALGSGDSDLSARALGLDWRRESAVGEFILGVPEFNHPNRSNSDSY